MKLAAVLNDESGLTAPSACGLSGSHPCRRWMPYTAIAPARLNHSIAIAYSTHSMSLAASMPAPR